MSNEDTGIFRSVEIGKSYPLSLSKADGKILTLQYLFKPANVADQIGGQLHGSDNSNNVIVNLNGKDDTAEVFRGVKRDSSSTDHESLLIFVDGAFKIQKVDEMVLNLRVQREESISKSKESSSKESKALVDSRKLPKFLQKSQPKKKINIKEASVSAFDGKVCDNTNIEMDRKPTDIVVDNTAVVSGASEEGKLDS
mmetsp:Transcript_19433/g.33662  ORF Transcript_19433/g.33662 Transcript_19433/m.33662 type:complete len:197 (-) Transcript_19433:1369-1959(-)